MRLSNRLIVATGAVIVAAALARAQTAGMLSVQGLIKQGDQPVPTNVDLQFRIWNVQSGGTVPANLVDMDGNGVIEDMVPKDAKEVTNWPVSPEGIFATKFGPVSPKAFDGTARYLEIRVRPAGAGAFSTLSRTELVTPPATAEQVNRPASGSSAIVTDASGNVGIGTSSPSAMLHVRGASGVKFDLSPNGGGQLTLGNNSGDNQVYVEALNSAGNGSATSLNLAGFISQPLPNLALLATTTYISGNVGISAPSPLAKLDVRNQSDAATRNLALLEDLNAAGSGGTALAISGKDDGITIANQWRPLHLGASGSGDAGARTITLSINGNVGIGSTAPGSKLVVSDGIGNVAARGPVPSIVTGTNNGGAIYLGPGPEGGAFAPTGAFEASWGGASFPQVGIGVVRDSLKGNILIDYNGRTQIRNGTTALVFVDSNGQVGFGNTNPGVKVDVTGSIRASLNVTASGNCCTGSDIRWKKNVHSMVGALQKLLALRGVQFDWKDPNRSAGHAGPQTGLIAQEVEKVFPEWVVTDADGYKYVALNGFSAVAVEAIRELKDENDALKAKVAGLERKLAEMSTRLDAISK